MKRKSKIAPRRTSYRNNAKKKKGIQYESSEEELLSDHLMSSDKNLDSSDKENEG
jgi:hypothetical protein